MKKITILIILLLLPSLAWGAAATMYVTAAGAGDNSGDSWANAMAYSDWETDAEGSAEAGDTYYFMEGEYTVSSDVNFNDNGTDVAPITLIGVKSGTTAEPPTIADYAYGDDRPLFTCGGDTFNNGDKQYFVMKNLRFTFLSTLYYGLLIRGGYLDNVKATGASNGEGIIRLEQSVGIRLEATNSSTANAIYLKRSRLLYSYVHDSTKCIGGNSGVNQDTYVVGTIIDTCTTGIATEAAAYRQDVFANNTFYNNTTHISLGTPGGGEDSVAVIVNNIFDTGTTGITAVSTFGNARLDNNVYSNISGDDVSNVTKGPNAITSDITLTDPANGDFTLPNSSDAEGVGFQVDTNLGITGDYNVNIGVDQTDTQAGGGTNANGAVGIGF